ncbi:MAG: PAS domain S-box protein, partial [Methanoregula sp.]
VNQMFCEMMGYNAGELRAMTFTDITHPVYRDQNLNEVKKIYTGELTRYRTEKRYIRKDGSELWGSLTVSPLTDGQGRIITTLALV